MDSSKILCGLDTRHLGLQQGGYPFLQQYYWTVNKMLQFLLPLVNNMSRGTKQKNKGSDKEGLL